MKRNWLSYVAIAAAIVAGSVCSTAFAGPPSFKFGGSNGGGNLRIGGSNNNSGGNNASRSIQSRIGNLGNQSNSGGMQAQIKKLPGNFNGNNFGQAIGGNNNRVTTPKITIQPGVVNQIKQGGFNGIAGGQLNKAIPQVIQGGNAPKINLGKGNVGQAIGNAVLNGNKNGNVGQAIGNVILGGGNGNNHNHNNIHCGPVKVGCKPWWNDCHHFQHNHCYKPVYPVCTKTIIVQVPVVVEQVAVAQPVMQVPVGATLTLQALGLGNEAGQVMLQVDKIAIPAMVNEWSNDAVTTTLPMLGLGGQVIADIVLVRADGTVANSIKVELINAQPQAAQAAVPAGAVQPAGFQADQGGAAAALGGL